MLAPAPPPTTTTHTGTTTPAPPRRCWCAASAPLTASTWTSRAPRPPAPVRCPLPPASPETVGAAAPQLPACAGVGGCPRGCLLHRWSSCRRGAGWCLPCAACTAVRLLCQAAACGLSCLPPAPASLKPPTPSQPGDRRRSRHAPPPPQSHTPASPSAPSATKSRLRGWARGCRPAWSWRSWCPPPTRSSPPSPRRRCRHGSASSSTRARWAGQAVFMLERGVRSVVWDVVVPSKWGGASPIRLGIVSLERWGTRGKGGVAACPAPRPLPDAPAALPPSRVPRASLLAPLPPFQAFLSLCQGNHYQFDSLRRAKHSSMMVLYHLHNPTAPAFACTCNVCQREIQGGDGFRCSTCPGEARGAAAQRRCLHVASLAQPARLPAGSSAPPQTPLTYAPTPHPPTCPPPSCPTCLLQTSTCALPATPTPL
jgi:hypothetical protein